MAIYDFFVSRNNAVSNTAAYVGHAGRLFYDSDNGVIKLSDGATPGGVFIPYNIATTTTIGGIKAGPGANVSIDGTLTIDTAGLPLSFGDFTANVNVFTTVNNNQDMVLATMGNAEIQLVGNIGFYRPNGLPPQEDHRYFFANQDGQVTILTPTVDPLAGAVQIIGSVSGASVQPAVAGVMLHVTGNNNEFATQYIDGVNNWANYIGRRYNGLSSSPTAVKSGNVLARFSAQGYTTSGFLGGASASISMDALEDFTGISTGSVIRFYTVPVGSNSRVLVSSMDNQNGLITTKATVTGNLTVDGNIVGNAVTTTATIGTGNITTLNVSGVTTLDSAMVVTSANVKISANIKYDITSGHAVSNNFNKNGGTVTANGRHGRLTSLADSIAKGAVTTFTVNNTYVGQNDVIVVNIASGGTVASYAVAVTAVSNGSFQVSVTNNGGGALAEALIFNFAVIKIS